jgi:3-dehydroquinate synthase
MRDDVTTLAPHAGETIRVALGTRSYDIIIGERLLDAAGGFIASTLPGARSAVVSDANVAALYLPRLKASLGGLFLGDVVVAPGEQSKSFPVLAQVCERLLELGVERGDVVIALGGGVVGDLAGFAASILRRGVRLVQMPTTLLAQVDSSVGGKTGINSPHGKNLVGAFHQPSLVLADTAALDSLSRREMRAGYAEVVKYGLIDDAGFFAWCEQNWQDVFAGGPAREEAVARSCRAKAAVVVRDEREDGDRALLNLGHTFGHALERITAYDTARLVHGEGVSIGLCLAYRFSVHLGLCPKLDAERVETHLKMVGLPTRLGDVPGGSGSVDDILDAMAQDKKVKAGALTFILTRGLGQSFVAPGIAADDVRTFLRSESNALR